MIRVTRTWLAIASVLMFSFGEAPVWAQAVTAQISGTITDAAGASVAGAEIVAIQTETGFRKRVQSNDTGSYLLNLLPLGPYR